MSGRTAHLAGGAAAGLVQAIPEVQRLTGQVPTLVGGLAVLAHVTIPHRATGDVDVVDRAREPATLRVLVDSVAAPDGVVGATIDTRSGPVRVDVLSVSDADVASLPDDPTDRLYVLAHHWAASSATPIRLVASGEEATARVAPPGPLVATKLQSAVNRGFAKQATDLVDVLRLVFDPRAGDEVDAHLREAEPVLAEAALLHAEKWFVVGAPATLRSVRGVPSGEGYTLDDVRTAGRLLAGALKRP